MYDNIGDLCRTEGVPDGALTWVDLCMKKQTASHIPFGNLGVGDLWFVYGHKIVKANAGLWFPLVSMTWFGRSEEPWVFKNYWSAYAWSLKLKK